MKAIAITLLLLPLFPILVRAQEQLAEYESSVEHLLGVFEVPLTVKHSVSENRFYSYDKLNSSEMASKLDEALLLAGFGLDDVGFLYDAGKLNYRPIRLRLEIGYLSLLVNDSKEVWAKGIIEVSAEGGDYTEDRFSRIIKEDVLIGKKMQVLKREGGRIDEATRALLEKIANSTALSLMKWMEEREEVQLFKITSYGCSGTSDGNPSLASEKEALRNGCEKAFGMSIESTTTLTDLADVSDLVKAQSNCKVLGHFFHPEYSYQVDTNLHCSLVTSILKK